MPSSLGIDRQELGGQGERGHGFAVVGAGFGQPAAGRRAPPGSTVGHSSTGVGSNASGVADLGASGDAIERQVARRTTLPDNPHLGADARR